MSNSLEWEKRFWSKVSIRGPTECWEWQAGKSKDGYGMFNLGGKMRTASRVAFLAGKGREPGSQSVLHTCDNSACCNPAHLYLGDDKQNAKDRVDRNRQRNGDQAGEANPAAKLTEVDVRQIRAQASAGRALKDIAADFGVSHDTVWGIARWKTWKKVV